MKGVGRYSLLLLVVAAIPVFAHAQVANFVFTSSPQSVAAGTVSQQLTLQAQSSGGTSTNIPSTACLSLTSSSPQGQFSSSATNWTPVSVLTMNKNTANKNFYYQDSQTGTPTITVNIALKPDSVSSSCASWPTDQWTIQWSATQSIGIGTSAPADQSSDSSDTTDNSTSSDTTDSSDTSNTQTQTNAAQTSSYVPPPAPDLYADAGADRTVIAGADTEFDAGAYDKNSNALDPSTVRFVWNFGDGETAEGQSVLHHYEYPGTYALVLSIAQDKNAAIDEATITAEPAKLSFETLADGGAEIDNLAGRNLDLSGWLVRSGPGLLLTLFTLPPHTVILSGSSMHISRATLGFIAGVQSELDYPNGTAALQAGQTTAPPVSAPSVSAVPAVASSPAAVAAATPRQNVSDVSADAEIPTTDEAADDTADATDVATSTETAAAAELPTGGAFSPWWLAAIALAGIAAIALIVAKKMGKKEWDIVEEK